MQNKEFVQKWCDQNQWNFQDLEQYVELIEEKNKVMNLTGFSGDELWGQGILESLVFMDAIVSKKSNLEILDIGAGAGFPSIPYAIVRQDLSFTIYEPLQKRVDFLNLVISTLGLKNVRLYAKRAEEVKEKNIFDIVTARAVGTISTMLMAAFHLVKVNGTMSLIKGKKYNEELQGASPILDKIKISTNIKPLEHPLLTKQNFIVEIKKLRSTPKEFPYLWKDILKFKNTKK